MRNRVFDEMTVSGVQAMEDQGVKVSIINPTETILDTFAVQRKW